MAKFTVDFHCDILGRLTSADAVMPDELKPGVDYPIIYLLHDDGGDNSSFVRFSKIEKLAMQYGVMVFMPDCGHGCCLNGPYYRYEDVLFKDIPEKLKHIFNVSQSKKLFIGGMGTGGYGAVKQYLKRTDIYSGAFSACAAGELKKCLQATNIDPGLAETLCRYEENNGQRLCDIAEEYEGGTEENIFIVSGGQCGNDGSMPRIMDKYGISYRLDKCDSPDRWEAFEQGLENFIRTVVEG